MENIRLTFISTIVFVFTFSYLKAQVIQYKNLDKVSISDPSQLYYDYPMTLSDWESVGGLVNNDKNAVEHIRTYGFETGWPDKLKSIDWRIAHPEVIMSLVGFYLGNVVPDFLSLLIIPKKENKEMLKKVDVLIKNDIYILIPLGSFEWLN